MCPYGADGDPPFIPTNQSEAPHPVRWTVMGTGPSMKRQRGVLGSAFPIGGG